MNTRALPIALALAIALALLAAACARNTDTARPDAFESTISDPESGVTLRVSLDATQTDAAGTIRVNATLSWPDGVRAELIEPVPVPADDETGSDAASPPPALERITSTPIAALADRFERTTTFRIVPELPGAFVLEGAGARIDAQGASRRIVRLAPIGFEVVSVLGEDDEGALDPPIGFVTAPEPSHARAERVIIGVSIAAAILGGVLVSALRRSGRRHGGRADDPRLELERVIGRDPLDESDLAIIHRAAADLDDAALLGAVETARYSGAPVEHERIRVLARRAARRDEGSHA